ncbi:MAG: hypothetical protein BGO96_13570 [Micrococcales bacterium 73-15]|nr:MAG: hypothetical protein BGO96_13570 [Micrococcales bacterium 73-15]
MAASYVQTGAVVDVVGCRGSGRTAFLGELRAKLVADGWTVLDLFGVASLRGYPLAALQVSPVQDLVSGRGAGSIPAVVTAMVGYARTRRVVLLVDDWDDLDEATWGAVTAAQRIAGFPMVLTHLRGRTSRQTPTGLDPAGNLAAYVIPLGPLRIDEIEQILEHRLGAPTDGATLNRIFAKSGGLVGLALSVVDVAVREGALTLANGVWSATRSLWSPALSHLVEAMLETLLPAERDALATMALLGVIDVATARTLVDWEVLESLEAQALLSFHPSRGRRLASIEPPLLVEYFRHDPFVARRIRITEALESRLGTGGALLPHVSDAVPTGSEADASFVRLVHEQARAQLLISRVEWTRDPSAATALRYLTGLSGARAPVAQIEAVLSDPRSDDGGAEDRARLLVWRAWWTAYAKADLEEGLRMLRETRLSFGSYGRLLDAAVVQLCLNRGTVPADHVPLVAVEDDLPESVRAELEATRILVLVSLGRFVEARDRLDASTASSPTPWLSRDVLTVLVLIGEGRNDEAIDRAGLVLSEARNALDAEAIRCYSYLSALCLMVRGEHGQLRTLVETWTTLGDPPHVPSHDYLATLCLGAVTAVRLWRVVEEENRALDQVEVVDGPLSGMVTSWRHAERLAASGDREAAAHIVADWARALWDRGARLAAMLAYATAVEIAPDEERLAEAESRARDLDGVIVEVHLELLRALVRRDVPALTAGAARVAAAGFHARALRAYQEATRLLREEGRVEAADAVERERAALVQRLTLGAPAAAREETEAVTLTAREHEVAQLVAAGLSNQQIAAELVISVRTVENHVHRTMRKTGAANRRMLGRLVTERIDA